ncbi:MAG: PPC domain-containing protein [Planctomycetota bacterium]
MSRVQCLAVLAMAGLLAMSSAAQAQPRPYIGFAYPAGGQQGTTFQIKMGGQGLEDIKDVIVSGPGVTAKAVEYFRKMGPQDVQLLREQLQQLKEGAKGTPLASLMDSMSKPGDAMMTMMSSGDSMMMQSSGDSMMASGGTPAALSSLTGTDKDTFLLAARIVKRVREYVNRPACVSISSLVDVEVAIAPDAKPGPREIRLVTLRGVSNPLAFHVGQLPEIRRRPMTTAEFQVVGKEYLAQRKRPDNEIEQRITLPCTANGQIASGEVNAYRFEARKGQRLVIAVQARQLIPYLADAVPGWFQPVLALYDASGKELAYDDDYRFKPDPVIFFTAPQDGEYVFTITDAIYRGREDFIYRVSIGELPFVTSIFPLGGREGMLPKIEMKGWNLEGARLAPPAPDAKPGIHSVVACRQGIYSNSAPFAVDTLPECLESESNNAPACAQKVTLPIIVNGRINRKDDWDVFQFSGRAGDTVVAEVMARRLDSPLDSLLKVTDAKGNVLALNDDCEDLGSGLNTHHADSYIMVKLPADGAYCIHLGDTPRNGGEEYTYRLRISAPRPDFALRVVPSSLSFRGNTAGWPSILVLRLDGFAGPITLALKDPPAGFSSAPVKSYPPKQPGTPEVPRLGVKTTLAVTEQPVTLIVEGRAQVGEREIVHQAVPAEDRMQAFLWRHLVPAEALEVLVFDPAYEPPPKRVARPISPEIQAKAKAAAEQLLAKNQKFDKKQVVGRLRQLKLLFEDGLLTDDFYGMKVAECEAAQ